MAAIESATLEGVVERVTFTNEENGWSVVRLAVSGSPGAATVVGNLAGIQPGEALRLSGQWRTDPKYGEQFRAESFHLVQPATLTGIEKYLGSGMVRGLGRVMAERLVGHFGLETLEVIERQPERLAEVEGIGPKRTESIRSAWAEQREIREVMLFLQSHGVSPHFAAKIFKEYGQRAISQVRENPYRLAIDIFGIGFGTADRIARSLGIPGDSPRRAEAGLLHQLMVRTEDGQVYLPRELLVRETAELLGVGLDGIEGIEAILGPLAEAGRVKLEPLADGDDAVYLPALHSAEVGSAALLGSLLGTPAPPLEIDVDRALEWFQARSGLTLAQEQTDAIRRAISSKVLVITGGPGTGKTTLVNGVIEILERKRRRILLAAPTGRAAKRLTETTGREAKTIHRLLELNPRAGGFGKDSSNLLECDLLIVDETSMVDATLAYHLLKALPSSCQLILVGDVDQLPSVGAGRVLQEIIGSGVVPVVRLQRIFRQAEASGIIANAHRINHGKLPLIPDPSSRPGSDFLFLERESPEAILETLMRLVKERIPRHLGVDPIDDIQVLTPMHRGLLGSSQLNLELQNLLNPSGELLQRGSRAFRVGDKVMQLRNNYDLDVFNGDLGRVAAVDLEEQRLTVRFDGRPVAYDFADLDELTLAYACSIHKSQGSEYPCVVLPLHSQHQILLQRNLLYTAVTRGRRLVVIVGSLRALKTAVEQAPTGERYSRLGSLVAAELYEQLPGALSNATTGRNPKKS